MTATKLAEWEQFLTGHWQRELPKVEGRYLLATKQGEPTSETVVVYRDPRTCDIRGQKSWGGWYWSEPTPDLPAAPPGDW